MMTNTQNIIRTKFDKLIYYISQMGDDVRIEDRGSELSLTIDVYSNKRRLLSFKLYQLAETDTYLEVAWGALGRNMGHWDFPDFFDQYYMFKRLVSVITDWYKDIVNSNLDKILQQAEDKANCSFLE